MKKILFLLVLVPFFFGFEKQDYVYPENINNTVWETRTYATEETESVAKFSFLKNGLFKFVVNINHGNLRFEAGVENNLYYTYENGVVKTSGHFDFYNNGYFLNLQTNECLYMSDLSNFQKRQFPYIRASDFNVITTLKMEGIDKLVSGDGTVFYRK